MKIARQFHWEMGHRLPFHAGLCKNIHGHSYRMWVELEGACDDNGMLIDYGEMKALIQPLIDPLDHCFLSDKDDHVMKAFVERESFKTLIVPFSTTAENLSRYMIEKIWRVFDPYRRIVSITVRIAETENSYAEITRNREGI